MALRPPLRPLRRLAVGAAVLALTLPLAACGDDADASFDGPPQPVAEIAAVQGKTTAIKLDKGFVEALDGLGLTPGVTGAARLVKGSLVFPISGGNVSVYTPGEVSPYVIGQLQHEGSGLTLAAGGTTVRLSNFNVDPGVSRVYGDVAVNGSTAVTNAYLFRLDGRTLKDLATIKDGRFAVLEGTKVFISDVAAGLLNDTYGTKAVTDQLLVGIAKITVNTKSA
ncbi:hypothetical protein I601_2300 [Nocardioides dokdonensis FR1436]|uniref:Lipoprotein n=1 Tax=Nocardioides dokdonensis FR1436 TaxID=1300347 RepID=A0A1A9GKC6_9ACTN|nr:hypothetical protein [Nocardioides dokdonensis]ANH38724.1 hypothetical protein I601_2300 [Nocardioides dokdonensis FR1436]